MFIQPFGFLGQVEEAPEPVTQNNILLLDANDPNFYPGTGLTVYNTAVSASVSAYSMGNSPSVAIGTNGNGVKYIEFTGTNSSNRGYLYANPGELTSIGSFGSDFTMEVGFEYHGSGDRFYSVRTSSSTGYNFETTKLVYFGVTVASFTTATTSNFVNNQFGVLCVVASGANLDVYWNGSHTETLSASATRTTSPTGWEIIGAQGNSSPSGIQSTTYPVTTTLNFFRLYNNKALTPSEVSQNFEAKRGDMGI